MADVPRKLHFCSIVETSSSSRFPWQPEIHKCREVTWVGLSIATEYRLSTDTWQKYISAERSHKCREVTRAGLSIATEYRLSTDTWQPEIHKCKEVRRAGLSIATEYRLSTDTWQKLFEYFRIKNLGRQPYHTCPQPVHSEAYFTGPSARDILQSGVYGLVIDKSKCRTSLKSTD